MAKKKLCELLDAYNRAVKLHSELKDVEMEIDKNVEIDADMEMRKSSISVEETIDVFTKED